LQLVPRRGVKSWLKGGHKKEKKSVRNHHEEGKKEKKTREERGGATHLRKENLERKTNR